MRRAARPRAGILGRGPPAWVGRRPPGRVPVPGLLIYRRRPALRQRKVFHDRPRRPAAELALRWLVHSHRRDGRPADTLRRLFADLDEQGITAPSGRSCPPP
jgi:hypothetical protein